MRGNIPHTHSGVQCSAVQCSAVQCSAVQCSVVQNSAGETHTTALSYIIYFPKLMFEFVFLSSNISWQYNAKQQLAV